MLKKIMIISIFVSSSLLALDEFSTCIDKRNQEIIKTMDIEVNANSKGLFKPIDYPKTNINLGKDINVLRWYEGVTPNNNKIIVEAKESFKYKKCN